MDQIVKQLGVCEKCGKQTFLVTLENNGGRSAERCGDFENCGFIHDLKIPKRIISMWVGPSQPAIVEKCLATHKLEGYEHMFIDNATQIDEEFRTPYFHECIAAGKWGKLSDYLRICYLEKYGGIYLDADTEVMRSFDDVLNNELFVCEEENKFIANGIIGAIPHHPMLKHYRKLIEENFRGGGDLVFQPGMYLWTELVKYSKWSPGIKIYSDDWFLPYNHQSDKWNITENTHTKHYYLKSWLEKHEEKGSQMADSLEPVPKGN